MAAPSKGNSPGEGYQEPSKGGNGTGKQNRVPFLPK